MEVKLIDYQEDALEILIYTKSTRLDQNVTIDDIKNWSIDDKMDHLDYMRHTIASSWEFVSYIFQLTDVSRVFTHQLVRTRTQSYAQESQRTIDAKNKKYYQIADNDYDISCLDSFATYNELKERGFQNQDARYVLPEGTLTNIIVGTNLRTLSQTAETRLCTRTAGEYQEVFKAMKQAVVNVHPWAEPFIKVACAKTGICIFPNYRECPIQKFTYNGGDEEAHRFTIGSIDEVWKETNHVANPVAKNGKTM